VVNFHSLGNPEEIEGNVRWLELEMKKRGIFKPIIISDTGISPFVGLGPATSCKGKQVAILLRSVIPRASARGCKLTPEGRAKRSNIIPRSSKNCLRRSHMGVSPGKFISSSK